MKLSEIYQNSLTNRAMDSVGRIYSNSLPSRFFLKWSEIYKNSRLHYILNSDRDKAQTYKDSLSYGALKRIIVGISKSCGAIHDYITEYFNFSVTGHIAKVLNEDSKKSAAVLFFTAVGYALGKTVLQRWSRFSAVLFAALVLLSLAAVIPASRWKSWFKQSLFSKLINFFFEK
ncbi:MAG: hypothetical protein PHV32_12760 [Eubacteriales bacterium]|nr:hypothetical protein [Eubacteriales bacterium]